MHSFLLSYHRSNPSITPFHSFILLGTVDIHKSALCLVANAPGGAQRFPPHRTFCSHKYTNSGPNGSRVGHLPAAEPLSGNIWAREMKTLLKGSEMMDVLLFHKHLFLYARQPLIFGLISGFEKMHVKLSNGRLDNSFNNHNYFN